MNPLGKALNKVLNPSVENVATTFSNNYNGTSISFEGFFGNLMKSFLPKKEEVKFKNPDESHYDYSTELERLMKKTILNSTWIKNNPGKEIKCSQDEFGLAFLFESDDVVSELKDWNQFRTGLLDQLQKYVDQLVAYEEKVVNEFLTKCPSDPENDHDKYISEVQAYIKEVIKEHSAISSKFRTIKSKYKDFMEVTLAPGDFGFELSCKLLKTPEVTITPEKMIAFVEFITKEKMGITTWDYSVERRLWDFKGGPHFEDDDPIWGSHENEKYTDEFRTSDASSMFVATNQGFISDDRSKSQDLDNKQDIKLGSILDKMFGASDDS